MVKSQTSCGLHFEILLLVANAKAAYLSENQTNVAHYSITS